MTVNHKRVQSLMQQLDLKGKCKRRKYRSYKGEVGKITNNLLQRDFTATKPNDKWVTGISEFKCDEEKLYLSPMLEQTIHEYIHYYNHERIQVKLKGLNPVEYRTQSLN